MGFRKRLTLVRVVVALFALPMLFYVYGNIDRETLIIDAVSVFKTDPTPEVLTNGMGDALRQIETNARRMGWDFFENSGYVASLDFVGCALGVQVWQPEKYPRLSGLLEDLRKQLTLKGIVLALLVLPVLFYICREVAHNALVIEPFSVPKHFEENGLTPEVVADRIGNAIRQIETNAQTLMKKDNLISLHDEGSPPDVEIPGTKVGLKTLVEITRAVLGIHPKHVSGDIVALPSAESPAAMPQVKVTIYMTQGRNRGQAMSHVVNSNDIDGLSQNTAEMILGQINPYILAAHRYDHGEIERAVELLQRIVQDSSGARNHVAAAFNFLGSVLYGQKKYDEAIVKFKKAIEHDRKYAPAYSNWGSVLYDQKKYDEAIAKFQKAIEHDRKYAPAYNNWGNLLSDQQKYDEAVTKYQKAIDLDPKFADPYNNWGIMLYDQEKYDEAVAKFQKAIEVDPKYATSYNSWGRALYDWKKYDEAAAKYKKAIDLDPKYALAYANLGLVLRDQKKYDEAEEKFAKARELSQGTG
jgi:tetratricopeptide (TPR) repeat protein